jgi:ABC-type amino acid transport substrate-binding protein
VFQFVVITVAITLVSIVAVRLFFTFAFDPTYTKYKSFIEMEFLHEPVQAKVYTSPLPPSSFSEAEESGLQRIRKRDSIRVGYFKDSLPFAFTNAATNLVGFDIEMAHLLAGELGVTLELVLIERDKVAERLNDGYCDIVMSGLAITTGRAQKVLFSVPYIDQTLAFVVEDHRREEFKQWENIRKLDAPRIGIPNVPYFIGLVRTYLPEAKMVTLNTPRDFFRKKIDGLDALVHSAEAGSAWTLVYPDYSVVVPIPDPIAVPVAYAMARGERDMVDFVNTWIELKKKDRTIERIYDHWILGRGTEKKEPRWSIIRNVLHWVE